jgi:hypothetical protein
LPKRVSTGPGSAFELEEELEAPHEVNDAAITKDRKTFFINNSFQEYYPNGVPRYL